MFSLHEISAKHSVLVGRLGYGDNRKDELGEHFMRVVCFFIHGIGTQDQNFSNLLKTGIHAKLMELNKRRNTEGKKNFDYTNDVDFEPIYWANLGSNEQDNLYRKVFPELYSENSFFKKFQQYATMRSLSVHLIGDVVGYLGKFEGPIKRTVFDQLAKKLQELTQKGSDFSIIVVAHSLGSVILHDLISGLQHYEYTGFNSLADKISIFTMGSPLSLFMLRRDANLKQPFRKWVNFFHPRDPVAFPMNTISKKVTDIKVNDCSFDPMKLHSMYWQNSEVHESIAKEIVDHFEKPMTTAPTMDFFREPPPEVFQPCLSVAANAGFSEYVTDFEQIPFDKLISNAKEIDICFVYGGHWVGVNNQYIIKALTKPDVVMRVFMLSPDSPSLPGFSHHFSGKPKERIIEEIRKTTEALKLAVEDALKSVETANHIGKLQIYYSLNIINHSIYRFDNVIYYTPRKLSSSKNKPTPIPTLVYRNTTEDSNFFRWLMRDLELIKDCSRDSILQFDSSSNDPSNN
jgi:hypothetical protein